MEALVIGFAWVCLGIAASALIAIPVYKFVEDKLEKMPREAFGRKMKASGVKAKAA